MNPEYAVFIASHRVARLATADASGRPHVIPVTYAFDGESIYFALDRKPKRVEGRQLKRMRNIIENPRVALVIDDYSEDWDELAYVLVQGSALVLDDVDEQQAAERLLRKKYPQYAQMLETGSTIVKIIPEKVIGWGRV